MVCGKQSFEDNQLRCRRVIVHRINMTGFITIGSFIFKLFVYFFMLASLWFLVLTFFPLDVWFWILHLIVLIKRYE